MSLVVDYAWQHPDPATIRRAGYVGVLRYLSPDASKNLSPPERDALFAAALSIGLVWESTAGRALQGWAAGVADAAEANRQADTLGWPQSRPIYYADDTQSTADQVRPYYQGAASVHRRPVGAYGDIAVVDPLLGDGTITVGWQTSAWSAGQVSRHAALYQRQTPTLPSVGPGGTYDENAVLADDWGQWDGGRTFAPPSPPAPAETAYPEDNMRSIITVVGPVDANGNGFFDPADVPDADKVVNVVVTAVQNPPDVGGYPAIPHFGVREQDGHARAVLEGGQPNGTYRCNVWVAS